MKGNLVGVVAPTEWEAIRAAQQVASATKWTRLERAARQRKPVQTLERKRRLDNRRRSRRATRPEATSRPRWPRAAKKLSATYELPFMKHAPIGPTMALADARAGRDRVHLHAQPKSAGAARRNRADARHVDRSTSSCAPSPAPATTEDRTAAMPAPKTKRSFCRRPWAGRCACSGCGRRISSGRRNRRPRTRTSKSGWMRTARWSPIRSITTCPRCRTTGRLGAVLAGLPTMAAPNEKARLHRLDGQRYFRSLGVRRRRGSDGARPRHIPGRAEGVAARDRPPRSQHADAGTVPAEFPARTGRSARPRRLPRRDAIQFRIDHARKIA